MFQQNFDFLIKVQIFDQNFDVLQPFDFYRNFEFDQSFNFRPKFDQLKFRSKIENFGQASKASSKNVSPSWICTTAWDFFFSPIEQPFGLRI